MDSSPVFRQQSQNIIQREHMRLRNDINKMPADPKSSPKFVPPLSKRDLENRDPGSTEKRQKAPMRLGISRLPVLAKSLHLQTPSDFSQSYKKWEESPLAGKTKRKKPCTKPVPFNLSQPKSTRTAAQSQKPLHVAASRTGTHAPQPEKTLHAAHPKNKNINEKLQNAPQNIPNTLSIGQHFATTKANPSVLLQRNRESTMGTEKPQGLQPSSAVSLAHVPKRIAKHPGNTSLGEPGYSSTCTTGSVGIDNPSSSIPNYVEMHQNSLTTAADCLKNLDLLSLKDPSKIIRTSQPSQCAPSANLPSTSTGSRDTFQLDHAALLSILKNKGISVTGPGSTIRKSMQPYNYMPQRVSVMKSLQKPGPSTGAAKSAQFSPDPAALRSILQNEGVKPRGPLETTPRNSVCPSGRSTSVYTAQRVPVAKCRAGTTGGPAEGSPATKWTPQRIPNTRSMPMSMSMKRLLSAQRTPCSALPGLRGLQGHSTELQTHKEEIVQRLFNDQEEDETEKEKEKEKEEVQVPVQKSTGGQPFFQVPHRESVIFFSTGKKLHRAPLFEKQESFTQPEEPDTVPAALTTVIPEHAESTSGSEASRHFDHPVPSQPRDILVQKSAGVSSAVALLRSRLPPLDELRLDEEVATYTSAPVPLAPQPPRPRCHNPLASTLFFQESTGFVPICCDPSSDPSSGSTSPCSPLS